MKRGFFFGLVAGSITVLAVVSLASLTGLIDAQGSRTVQLRQGWNQLVWTDESQAADAALAPIADKMPIAYGWQGDSQTFSRYVPDNTDVSTMSEVAKDSAYWLLMTQDFSFDVPTDEVQCPTPTPCPVATWVCPPAPQQACTDARMHASHLEISIAQYQEYDLPTTYLEEELATVEAWLNAYCR